MLRTAADTARCSSSPRRRLTYLPVTTDPRTGSTGAYTTLAGALDALHTAVTHGARTTASWWIDTRGQNTPL